MVDSTDETLHASCFCCGRRFMPSLTKMPSAARHFASYLFPFLNHSPTPQRTSGNSALPRTPRTDPKQRVNDGQTMSDGQANGVHVSKVDYCGAPAASKESKKNTKTSKWERIKVKNVEQWVPSTREKELLRRTWSDDFEFLFDLGSSIYCYIFENNPKCKQLFPFILKYEGDEWKNSREFRAQALKFVQTISQVVKNIYHMSRLEPYLYGIGQAHCKYADRGFRPDHWDVFQDAMEHSLAEHASGLADLDAEERQEAVVVWRTLALFVIAHMKAGFFDGLKSINKHPPLT